MQRWFFADEAEACDAMAAPQPSSSASALSRASSVVITMRPWRFCVLVNDQQLLPNEKLAVVGNCDSLGAWQFSDCVVMNNEDADCSRRWSVSVSIPCERATEYRFLVCASDPATERMIVRRWETHLEPRLVPALKEDDYFRQEPCCHDIFGVQDIAGDNAEKIDRGWLTSETLVQLKFFNAPFTWKQRMKRRLLFLKVTPMHLHIPSACENSAGNAFASSPNPISPLEESSLSNDTHDTRDNPNANTSFAFNEVAMLSIDDSVIRAQPQFGAACGPDDMVIFHLTIGDFESTAYLIDLYTYSSKGALDEPPYHFGYHYVLPNLFKRSEGQLEVPITCATKHRPMGMMNFGYLIVRGAVPPLPLDMHVSYSRYWNPKWRGLDVGHRGCGVSFNASDCELRENTIHSLKSAVEHGADMVEFDVQLSKDLVPVVYHDFMVYVSLKSKNSRQTHDFLELPMRDLTLEQLKNLKVYHTAEGRTREERCFNNDDLLEHQPFPQLADVLDAIDSHVGFNIEVKWSQRLHDGTMEEQFEHVVDRNLYIDCILDVVLHKAAERRIVFSCFDPDICTMLRYKQNRYPVMFLTLGETTKYKKYMDPRGNSIETAVFNSVAMELLGIVAHTEDLLRDPSQVNLAKSRGLVIFCWGDDNNSKDTIKLLKDLGLHAIIYDRMDVLTTKEDKQNVFQIEARGECQKDLFNLQALEMGKVRHNNGPRSPIPACSTISPRCRKNSC